MMKQTLIAISAAAIALSATPSFAKDVAVSYGDLNLSSIDGQKTLERRLDRAAKKACGYDVAVTSTRMSSPKTMDCMNKAKAQAQTTVATLIEDARLGG
jgi:UrcA family protein